MNSRQLFTPLKGLALFDHYSVGHIQTKDGSNLPHIEWPDGSPCLLANLYMLSLTERRGRGGRRGLSRRGSKGGTTGEYAAKISQLVRYCHTNNIGLAEMTDNRFTFLVNSLRAERDTINPDTKKKSEITLTATGRIFLDFLSFVGAFNGNRSFVGPEGTIRATKKENLIRNRRGDLIRSESYWHHHSFSDGDRHKRRGNISNEVKERLKAAAWSAGSRFMQNRRSCLLSLLERTGARRGEIAEIRVSDILAADRMSEPMLRIITLKQVPDAHRFVPVSRILLSELKKHIRIFRKNVIRHTLGVKNDHDYFFISETTGAPLKAETLTGEIATLRKIARVDQQACAHMFRHAFITNLFVILIERHAFQNEDDFRKALLGSETFKEEVMQWTGQRSAAVIDDYLHLAFAEVAGYAETLSSVHIVLAMEIFDQRLLELITRLEEGMPLANYREEVKNLIRLRDSDFADARRRSIDQTNPDDPT